jgi:hypothetical protein
MLPTKKLRTHTIILTDDREFHTTREWYLQTKMAYNDGKASDIFTIRDPDTDAVLFEGKLMYIKEFKERKVSVTWIRFICDFGNRHAIQDTCDCCNEYGINASKFSGKCHELYPNVRYAGDLQPSQREEILRSLR